MNGQFGWRRFRTPAWVAGLYARELIGWILVVAGLVTFRVCFDYLDRRQVVEGLIAAMIGYGIFRAGFQLVKVAVAARSYRHAVEDGRPTLRAH